MMMFCLSRAFAHVAINNSIAVVNRSDLQYLGHVTWPLMLAFVDDDEPPALPKIRAWRFGDGRIANAALPTSVKLPILANLVAPNKKLVSVGSTRAWT
jgi:hypothetical protein